jgi:hypothetical protein
MAGDVCYVDIEWDSPLLTEDAQGNVSVTDPNATHLIHKVWWANSSSTSSYTLTLRHNQQPFTRIIQPNTPETSHTFAPNQRPDMRDLSGIVLVENAL